MKKLTLKQLVALLWENIENGTVEENFFELREKVRKSLYKIRSLK